MHLPRALLEGEPLLFISSSRQVNCPVEPIWNVYNISVSEAERRSIGFGRTPVNQIGGNLDGVAVIRDSRDIELGLGSGIGEGTHGRRRSRIDRQDGITAG